MNCKKALLLLFFVYTYTTGFTQIKPVSDSLIEKKNIIDKTLDLFEYNAGRVSISVYPLMSLDPGSGWSFGTMPVITISPKKISDFYRPTSIVNHFSYSTEKWLNLKSDVLLYTHHGNEIKFFVQYTSAPDKFYGIGQTKRNYEPTTYSLKEFKIRGNISKDITKSLYIGLILDISHIEISGIESFSQKNNFIGGAGPQISYDTRDNINYPSQGIYIASNAMWFPPTITDGYEFGTLELDIRKYHTLYKDIIGAIQLFNGFSQGDTPFYYLYQLGGKTRMRGISNKNLYINNNSVYLQGELRKHVWNRFGFAVFGGLGNAYSSINTFEPAHTKYIYGAGLRFQTNKRDKLNLRIDYGRGSYNDSGIYITMREAF
ncbi:MAG: BamA/TamA family outer membrane protein [Bacteroidales bacterium]